MYILTFQDSWFISGATGKVACWWWHAGVIAQCDNTFLILSLKMTPTWGEAIHSDQVHPPDLSMKSIVLLTAGLLIFTVISTHIGSANAQCPDDDERM